MSLDQLSERLRTERVKRRAQSLATIIIKRAEPIVGEFRFGGRVLIDGQRLGSLMGCEPKTVYVEPGKHKITIIFERRPAILPRLGRTMCSASVAVSAGERAVFGCGI